MRCSCRDCVGFAQWVASLGAPDAVCLVDQPSDSVDMVQFFRSDVRVVSGADMIRACKLKRDAPLIRYYAECCSTPIGLSPAMAFIPIVAMYRDIIAEDGRGQFPRATAQIAFGETRAGAVVPEGVTARQGMLDVAFVLRALSRVFYGAVLGKGAPHPFRDVDHSESGIRVVDSNDDTRGRTLYHEHA